MKLTPEELDTLTAELKGGISPAEYTWRELKGFIYLHKGFMGSKGGCFCMNCHSEVILIEGPRENCPNDECYNFARGIDFWLTAEEWMVDYDSLSSVNRHRSRLARSGEIARKAL